MNVRVYAYISWRHDTDESKAECECVCMHISWRHDTDESRDVNVCVFSDQEYHCHSQFDEIPHPRVPMRRYAHVVECTYR